MEWLISHTTAEQVVFSGGEPTLCERFEELALHAKVNGLRVTVITNGNGPGRVYEALARMGVDLLEFSVLSAQAATHDGITDAAGSWERTTRELRLALERGVEVVPVTVVTALNADGVGECLEMLCGMGVRRVMVNRYNVGGEGLGRRGVCRRMRRRCGGCSGRWTSWRGGWGWTWCRGSARRTACWIRRSIPMCVSGVAGRRRTAVR